MADTVRLVKADLDAAGAETLFGLTPGTLVNFVRDGNLGWIELELNVALSAAQNTAITTKAKTLGYTVELKAEAVK
jgi:hypothetical protein